MSTRVLLADDSPHAQRMGERILREEGYEVITAVHGDEAAACLAEMQPDLVLVDVFLPGRSGYDLCRFIRSDASLRHAGVILIAGLLEPVDEEEAKAAGADAVLKKPIEASAVIGAAQPLIDRARYARGLFSEAEEAALPTVAPATPARPLQPPEIDPERVRAAVTLALDRSMPSLIQEITEKVVIALGH